ncbi:unnamed protein product [Symbiodinium pilosum]|uniref:Uncharacterized protein n=1 Tax=Symbiodinium pilosum TaxID=2952 RepID=A0A812P092_SYMPI|nr:unnamed protein product [Symbiodinium pilosum]
MDFRRLELSLVAASAASSMWTNLLGQADASDQQQSDTLWLTKARVSTPGRDLPIPRLSAALDTQLEEDGPIQVAEQAHFRSELTVVYDCWQPGEARVELYLTLAADLEGNRSQEICMTWTKICRLGFEGLVIRHGEYSEWLIYPAPNNSQTVTPPLLDTDGTAEDVTKLQLSSPEGTMRLQLPTVSSSDDKLLKVDIRGVAVTMNQGEQFLEVSSEPTEISVIYTCQGAGVADVELGLWHAVITSAHAAEGFHLHWRKQCGEAVYKFMDIFLKSDLNMTKVQAVSHGRALPGFEPRCRNQSKSSHPAVDGVSPKVPSPACGHQQSALEVSAKESKTSIELRVDPEGLVLPPALQHQPDMSFDQRIVKAFVGRMPEAFSRTGRGKVPCTNCGADSSLRGATPKAASQSMVVKYICHKQGVSPIMVTVYLEGYKPIDFSWQKRCQEPKKPRVGKALTAPQAMTMAFLVCGVIGLIVCMVCLFCSTDSKEKDKLFLGKGPSRRSRNIEFSRLGPDSERVGAGSDDEVVFH